MENINDDQRCKSTEFVTSTSETGTTEYISYQTEWQGIPLEVRHCQRWLCSHGEMIMQHIEIRSEDKVALPITGSGYLSHFMSGADALSEFGDDPVDFVHCWLDEAAKSKEWLAYVEAARQYSLF